MLRLLLPTLLTIIITSVNAFSQTATITTDKPDYAPLSTAIFTGSGFAPNEDVLLKVKNLNQPCNTITGDSSYLPWTVTADASGNFVTTWTVCNCPGDSLKLKATGQTSGLYAEAFFTDAVAITGPTSACVGESVTFSSSVSGAQTFFPTYRWRKNGVDIPGGDADNSSYTINPVTVASAGAYTLRATTLFGGSTSNTINFTVNPSPTTAIGGPDQTVCANSATLAGNAPSVGTGSWSLISGSGTITSPSSPASGVTGLGAGANTFRWTTSFGICTSFDNVIITFASTPAVPGAINAGTTQVCSNQTGITYTVSAVPSATLYTWTVPAGWNITNGQGTNTITVTSGASGQNGDVTVTAGNACGTSTARTLAVGFVDDIGFNNNVANNALTICAGSTSNIIIGGIAPSGPSYQWQVSVNGGGFVNAAGNDNNGNYTIDPSYYNTPGIYVFRRVISSSTPVCNGNSDNVSLTVIGPIVSSGTALNTICQGGTSNALGGTTSGTATGGAWSDGGVGGTFDPDASSLNATWTPPAAYSGTATLTLTTTGGSCGSISSAKTQLVNPNPTGVTATTAESVICTGTSTVLNGSASVSSGTITTILSDNFNGTPIFDVDGTNSGGGAIWTQRPNNYNQFLVATWSSPDNTNFMLAFAAAFGSATTNSTLTTSPLINTTGYTTLSLSFKHTYKQGDVGAPFGRVEVSTDIGNNFWTPVETYTTNQGSDGDFDIVTNLNLNSYINQSNLRFRFNFSSSVSANSSWWAIDDVVLNGNLPSNPQFSWAANPVATGGLPAGATTPSFSNTNISANPTQTTSYTLTASDPVTGCSATAADVIVTVNQLSSDPTAATASANPICSGESTDLILHGTSAGTGEVIRWYSDAGFTQLVGSGNGLTVSPLVTTTYWGRFEDPAPCNYNSPAQAVTVTVNTAPAITCPASEVLNTDPGFCRARKTYSATVSGSPAPVVTYSVNGAAIPFPYDFPTGITTVEVSAQNVCSPVATCSFTIEVKDNEAPQIFCPANISINCQDDNTETSTGTATATDNCDNPPAISFTDISTRNADINNAAHYNYTITRTWKAIDVAGNASTCEQVITVADVTAPVISCPASITLNCQDGSTPATTGTATATDNCSPVAINSTDVSTQDANVNNAGHYNYTITRTWTASDITGNSSNCIQTITVVDITAPLITCPAGVTVNCEDNTIAASTGTATATDNCSPVSITSTDVSTQDANTNSASHYNYTITRTWKATDVTGNSSTCNQVITVQDFTAPVITCPANIILNCQDNTTVTSTGTATATDNCSPVSITSTDVSTQDANTNSAGHYNYTITRTWKATDVTGNSSTCDQVITVQDVTAPVISCAGNVTLNCQDDNTPANTGTATATDNCSPVVITFTDVSTQVANVSNPGYYNYTITRTWRAADVTGNFSECIQSITVQDVTDPVITCPAPVLVNCEDPKDPANTGLASATDNCSSGANISISYNDVIVPGNCTNNYSINRTWKATDVSNNETTCLQVITVQDIQAPVITTCAQPVTVFTNNAGCTSILLDYRSTVTATDNCSLVTLTQSPAAGTALPMGANTVTITATDACGNTVSCQFIVTVTNTLSVVPSTNNPILYYGYTGDQTATVTFKPTGGAAPYKVSITMNRILSCNAITSAGDELWVAGAGTNTNTNSTCATSGPGLVPVSTANSVALNGSYSVNVTLMSDAYIIATVTDANGCIKKDSILIQAEDVRCFAGNSGNAKVTICHQTGSSKNPCVKICVSQSAVQEHLDHGDYVGICTPTCVPPTPAVKPVVVDVTTLQTASANLDVKVMPNPTTTSFNIVIRGKDKGTVSVRVMDVYGRVIYLSQKIGTNASLRLGDKWLSGTYFVEVLQGEERKIVKVIKAK